VISSLGCSDVEETRTLAPRQVAISRTDAPIYDDGELTIFESKIGIEFPLLAPTREQRRALNRLETPAPYPSHPWIENDDLEVQVSWVVTNLDPESHVVGILVDPWNEFGRYWPGFSLVDADDGEYLPNLSGYDLLIELPGTEAGTRSRRAGTATYDDLREMAVDLATVMQLLETPPSEGESFGDAELLAIYANHAFHEHNRSGASPLVDPYVPSVIAGLTGVDVGLRTFEPANVALEIVVELRDRHGERVAERGQSVPLLEPPDAVISAGAP